MAVVVQILTLVVQALSKGKGFFGTLVAIGVVAGAGGYGGMQYVNAKHQEGMIEVSRNTEHIKRLKAAQVEIVTAIKLVQNTLNNVNLSVQEVKSTVEKTDNRVWQIQREIKQ